MDSGHILAIARGLIAPSSFQPRPQFGFPKGIDEMLAHPLEIPAATTRSTVPPYSINI